jgi:hypothetical protein
MAAISSTWNRCYRFFKIAQKMELKLELLIRITGGYLVKKGDRNIGYQENAKFLTHNFHFFVFFVFQP